MVLGPPSLLAAPALVLLAACVPGLAGGGAAKAAQGQAVPAPAHDGVPRSPLPPAHPAPGKARTCTIGSFTGVMLPGTSVCAKVSGFVRVDAVTGGPRKPAWRP